MLTSVIDGGDTIAVGDAVRFDVSGQDDQIGVVDLLAAGERVGGVVVAIVDADGLPLGHPNADFDGTWTQSTRTYIAAADNETDKQVKAQVNIDPMAVYANDTDGTYGTTAESDKLGGYTDVADEDDIDEDNGSTAYTTMAQFAIMGPDPKRPTTHGLYKIAEWQFED